MSRRHLIFTCEGARLIGTLDEGAAKTGLLIVSGGNELRCGAWSGQAQLAAQIAAQGFPVLRFDRRGVGDSEGTNGGFRSGKPDVAAALAAFRKAVPGLERVIGFGNCDAASTLMLGAGCGLDGLVLSNPWTFETDNAAPPPEALRAHYLRRLADPAAIRRLLTGQVSLPRLAASLACALRASSPPGSLAQAMVAGLAIFEGPVLLLVAGRDRTGEAFLSGWDRDDPRLRICRHATHSYVEAEAREWLLSQVLDMLRR
ncbi:MAG: hydrolase 1, exosortase A system-associated [Novosphingobium sp.]|nr:hydrolase 1, exosortase A system-associated [Novosphingobium sp.]